MLLGLPLGGGFARGLAHIGVLNVLEQNNIPVRCIVAAGNAMRFSDVARWTIGRMGIAGSDRMERVLRKLLKRYSFEQMRIPLGVVATGMVTGAAVISRDRGDAVLPIRASCSYPGLFHPVRCGDHLLVDGAIGMEVPALPARMLVASHAISLHPPMPGAAWMPTNMFHVINRCFRILHSRTEITWRQHSGLVIEPDVRGMEWDAFGSATQLIKAGEKAARQAPPLIHGWIGPPANLDRHAVAPATGSNRVRYLPERFGL